MDTHPDDLPVADDTEGHAFRRMLQPEEEGDDTEGHSYRR